MIAVASGGLFIWPSIAKLFNRAREIGVSEAVLLINRNVPAGELTSRMKDLEKLKAKPVLLVCQSGARSAQTCSALQKDGYAQAVALAGGMAAWQQAGMPVEKDS